jgi:hypothetical protein
MHLCVCFFVLLFVCTSADGTAIPAAVTKLSEDALKKKVTGNYKFAMTIRLYSVSRLDLPKQEEAQ